MATDLSYLPPLLSEIIQRYGDDVRLAAVEDLEAENAIFVQDGNHGEYRPLKHEFVANGIPFVRPPNLIDGRLDLANCDRINDVAFERVRKGIGRGGDIILTSNATIGRLAIAPTDSPTFVTNPQTTIWRSRNPQILDQRYLYYFMRSRGFQEQLQTHTGRNATFDYVSLTKQRSLVLPLPPLSEQKAIAEILGELDAKIELNRRMNETLESLARSLFKSWFVDFDPVRRNCEGGSVKSETSGTSPFSLHSSNFDHLFPDAFEHQNGELVPSGWVKTTLGDEVEFQTGFAFKSKFFTEEPPGIRLARGMNVKEGEFFWSSQARYWPAVTPDMEEYLVGAGDVLIGMDGSKVGKNWVRVRAADLPCLLVQRVARVRAAASIGENFIWILVGGSTFRYFVEAVKTGTSIPHISGGQIKSFDFIRPPRDDNRIFEHFESFVAPMTEQADKNHAESKTLAALRDTLLPRLLSGQLRVGAAKRVCSMEEAVT